MQLARPRRSFSRSRVVWATVPNLFSISYQDLEYTVSLEYATSVNAEFTKNTVRGITFLTGSGDWGVGCEDSAHCNVFTADFVRVLARLLTRTATPPAAATNH